MTEVPHQAATIAAAVVLAIIGAYLLGATYSPILDGPVHPTIGGHTVPAGLACEEDETISFVSVDTLGCVHIDAIRGEQ